MNKKSILISGYHHKELKKIAKSYNVQVYRLVEEMIIYFKKTGINPLEPKSLNPSRAMKELDKRFVSFLRHQESEILKPLRQEVYEYSKQQEKSKQELQAQIKNVAGILDKNSKIRNDHFLKELQNHKEIAKANAMGYGEFYDEYKRQLEALRAIVELIDSKNKSGIKNKLSQILGDANM